MQKCLLAIGLLFFSCNSSAPAPGPAGGRYVRLTWSAPLPVYPLPANAIIPCALNCQYNIERASGAGTFIKVNATPISGTSFIDSSVRRKTTYTYAVIAYDPNTQASSGMSASIQIYVP